MSVINIVEDAIYCGGCVGRISRRTPEEFAIQYPAAYEGKGTCRGCDKEVELQGASKVVRREKE